MRRLVRRLELIPEPGRPNPDSGRRLTDDDREFLHLLKMHHRQRKYKYMKEWWEKQDQAYLHSR